MLQQLAHFVVFPRLIRALALDQKQFGSLLSSSTYDATCLLEDQIITSELIGHSASLNDASFYRIEGKKSGCHVRFRPGPDIASATDQPAVVRYQPWSKTKGKIVLADARIIGSCSSSF
jgi:hypothetical protein